MFKSLFKKMDSFFSKMTMIITPKREKFFSNVVGYEDIKRLILRSIVGKEPVHMLLTFHRHPQCIANHNLNCVFT